MPIQANETLKRSWSCVGQSSEFLERSKGCVQAGGVKTVILRCLEMSGLTGVQLEMVDEFELSRSGVVWPAGSSSPLAQLRPQQRRQLAVGGSWCKTNLCAGCAWWVPVNPPARVSRMSTQGWTTEASF